MCMSSEALVGGQKPLCRVILSCADSRIAHEYAFGQRQGRFVRLGGPGSGELRKTGTALRAWKGRRHAWYTVLWLTRSR